MTKPDNVDSPQDNRVELTPPSAIPVIAIHRTTAELTRGLAEELMIGEKPAAVEGSSGSNQGEHRQPKVGNVLIPLPTDVTVRTGDALVVIDGCAIATTASRVQVPDVIQPLKSNVLRTSNDFFFVNDRPVVRGA